MGMDGTLEQILARLYAREVEVEQLRREIDEARLRIGICAECGKKIEERKVKRAEFVY